MKSKKWMRAAKRPSQRDAERPSQRDREDYSIFEQRREKSATRADQRSVVLLKCQ